MEQRQKTFRELLVVDPGGSQGMQWKTPGVLYNTLKLMYRCTL